MIFVILCALCVPVCRQAGLWFKILEVVQPSEGRSRLIT